MDYNTSTSDFGLVDFEECWEEEDSSTATTNLLRSLRWARWDDWNQVHPRLWVGGVFYSAEKIEKIIEEGFTSIFDCCLEHRGDSHFLKDTFDSYGISYNWHGTDDDGDDKRFDPWLYRGIPAIAKRVRDERQKVLVHCAAGINRGPSLGYGALLCLDYTPGEAREMIESVRDVGLLYAKDVEYVYAKLVRRGRV